MPPYVTRQPLVAAPGEATVLVDGFRLKAATVDKAPLDREVFVCDAFDGDHCGYLWKGSDGSPHVTRWQPMDVRPREEDG